MRRQVAPAALVAAMLWAAGCGPSRPVDAVPRATGVRAAARAYDGAPPTMPHEPQVGACSTCHDADGTAIAGIGVAPASPHAESGAAGSFRRCRQCHVPRATGATFVTSGFVGLAQGPWRGSRATPGAPPRIPHTLQLRGECLACHDGPGARAEVRTSHPERIRCRQCHVPE